MSLVSLLIGQSKSGQIGQLDDLLHEVSADLVNRVAGLVVSVVGAAPDLMRRVLAHTDGIVAVLPERPLVRHELHTVVKLEVDRRVREELRGQMLADPEQPDFPQADLDCCIEVDRFDFAMPVKRDNGLLIIQPVPLTTRPNGSESTYGIRGKAK